MREFLTSRRAKITPEQAGLRTYGGTRRVPGLRREEVALLAGVSVDYYTRLERGNVERRLGTRPRGARPRAAARRGRAGAPLRPRARRADDASATAPPGAAAGAAERPAHARRDDRRAGVRSQRAHGHPRRQPPRPRPLLAALRQPARAAEHGALRLPRPARRRLLRRLGAAWRTMPSPSCAPRPAATRTTATSRTSSASCRREASVPHALGRAQRRATTTRGSKRFHHPVVGDAEPHLRDDGARRPTRA